LAWAYNGVVPGPELRVKQGDRIRVTLVNRLPASTTIHWHGYPLPNAEDGVAGLTQNAIEPGRSYTYEFVASIPGTYWYHAHQDTEHQVPMGLYGALVVEPNTPGLYDIDRTVIVGDADAPNAALHIDAAPGQRVRLRVVSAYGEDMTGDPEVLTLLGAPYEITAIDGHDLNRPTRLGPERILIDTGQRYDLAFTMPANGEVRLVDTRARTGSRPIRHEWADLGSGSAPAIPDRLPTFDLTHYGSPAPDPVADTTRFDVSQDLTISNQVGFRYGSYQFVHMFNGKSFPDTPVILVHEGDLVRLRFINLTAEYHPIHVHGHVMSVIARNGVRLGGSPVHLDSILVGPHETWEVAFLADNPGLWMIHCHILVHAAYGLSAMVSYQGIWTPYTIGTQSGNFPE
jgi:FtsP/CotA-like multicopper oxidase with cupredoxin domain